MIELLSLCVCVCVNFCFTMFWMNELETFGEKKSINQATVIKATQQGN